MERIGGRSLGEVAGGPHRCGRLFKMFAVQPAHDVDTCRVRRREKTHMSCGSVFFANFPGKIERSFALNFHLLRRDEQAARPNLDSDEPWP